MRQVTGSPRRDTGTLRSLSKVLETETGHKDSHGEIGDRSRGDLIWTKIRLKQVTGRLGQVTGRLGQLTGRLRQVTRILRQVTGRWRQVDCMETGHWDMETGHWDMETCH
jgi:hypothetical protein